jgi:ATP-dependent DNA ligase
VVQNNRQTSLLLFAVECQHPVGMLSGFVRREIVAEVRFAEWTLERLFRHVVYRSEREGQADDRRAPKPSQ